MVSLGGETKKVDKYGVKTCFKEQNEWKNWMNLIFDG